MSTTTALLIDIDSIKNQDKIYDHIQPLPFSKDLGIKKGCIFIIPNKYYREIENIPQDNDERKKYLNSASFINSIKKKGYILYCKDKNVCELVDCFSCMNKSVSCIQKYLNKDTVLWVSCSLKDVKFKSKIKEMVETGFTDPYICKSRPLSGKEGLKNENEYLLCMMKK